MLFIQRAAALVIAAVILFERYEQKDKSGKNALAPSLGNAQITLKLFLLPIVIFVIHDLN
jgi:hypothetical protein